MSFTKEELIVMHSEYSATSWPFIVITVALTSSVNVVLDILHDRDFHRVDPYETKSTSLPNFLFKIPKPFLFLIYSDTPLALNVSFHAINASCLLPKTLGSFAQLIKFALFVQNMWLGHLWTTRHVWWGPRWITRCWMKEWLVNFFRLLAAVTSLTTFDLIGKKKLMWLENEASAKQD